MAETPFTHVFPILIKINRDAASSDGGHRAEVKRLALAAKAGATFISPFVGRLEDHGADGIGLLEEIRVLYDVHGFETQILAASLRNPGHVSAAAVAGADAATLPADVFKALVKHPLTDKGLDAFLADWGKTGQSIL